MPTEQELGRVPHIPEFSRKCMMIHRQVLGLSWLPSTQKSRIWGDFRVLNDCKSLVQHSLLMKEPNINDQGFILYLNDQQYLAVIYVR